MRAVFGVVTILIMCLDFCRLHTRNKTDAFKITENLSG